MPGAAAEVPAEARAPPPSAATPARERRSRGTRSFPIALEDPEAAVHRARVRLADELVAAGGEADSRRPRAYGRDAAEDPVHAGTAEAEVVAARPVLDRDRIRAALERRDRLPGRSLERDREARPDGADQLRRRRLRAPRSQERERTQKCRRDHALQPDVG